MFGLKFELPSENGGRLVNCSGKFSEEIKLHLAHLRSKFSTKNQRGSDKLIANERTAESRIETAMGVSCALIVFSGYELSFCNRSIESALTSANSTNPFPNLLMPDG